MADFVSHIVSGVSSEKELRSIHLLISHLSTPCLDGQYFSKSVFNDNDELTAIDQTEYQNPFPTSAPDNLCTDQDLLNRFTCYLFDRRFGWSEANTEDGQRVRRLSTGATMYAGTEEQKALLNSHLDLLIKWYMHQDLTCPLLLAMKHTIKQCATIPVVRNRTVIHVMDWWRNKAHQLSHPTLFPLIMDVVVMSLTDVWSAIRNACASRLPPILTSFSITDIESLFKCLVKICHSESAWQAKEGAIMGVNAVLQQFLSRPSTKSPLSSPRGLDPDSEVTSVKRIPSSISEEIHAVIFSLLSNPQLTIREHTAKTLATYITCSSIADALSTLNEVVSVLQGGPSCNSTVTSQGQRLCQGPIKFLDDFAAEGFLGVCIFLVKVLPLSHLLPGWQRYISTFMQYISHPASTVRQAASSVFKYLVVKGSHSVVVLKLILQALAMGWSPNTEAMTTEVPPDSTVVGHAWPSVTEHTGEMSLASTWEGREGRLFAYELIFKYLIKNHWLYTFGPAGSGFQSEDKTARDQLASVSEEICNTVNHHGNNTYSEQCVVPDRPLPHVESEKSLAVRFLTQAELSSDGPDVLPKKPLERIQSVSQGPEKPGPQKGRYSPRGLGHAPGQYDTMVSLLSQAQMVDACHTEVEEKDRARHKQHVQTQNLQRLVEAHAGNNIMCKCSWMEKEYLQDMSRILKVILYQTAESLGDAQWELRRIANQVLPCLAEVIRWYDVNLLVSVWNSYLHPAVPTCLMTFTSVLLLKESIIHAVRLVPLLHKPPHSWQDPAKCRDCISMLVSTINTKLPQYLPHLQHLLQRACWDRLSVLAAEIILMSHDHLDGIKGQKPGQYSAVLQFWKTVFCFAHPQTRISAELLLAEQKLKFVSPFEGFLSCCLVRPDSKTQCAKQVEKLFITEVHHRVVAFIHSLSMADTVTVAPILAHYVGLFVDNSHVSRTAAECLSSVSAGIVNYTNSQTDTAVKRHCLQCILLTLKELAAVIAMKSMELPQIQKVLSIYEALCGPVNPSRHVRVALMAISSRLNETVHFTVEHSPRPGYDIDDLCLLSNDIPRSQSPEIDTDSDSEEVIVGTPGSNRFPESLTLNTSNNSGSLTGRLSALSVCSGDVGGAAGGSPGDSDGDTSDWDSWDEEEESQSAFSEVFAQFLEQLQKVVKLGRAEFMAEIRKLGDKEKNVILALMK